MLRIRGISTLPIRGNDGCAIFLQENRCMGIGIR